MPNRCLPWIIFIAATMSSCAEGYSSQALQYHAAAQEVLIAKGVCSSVQDCRKSNLMFWEAGGGAYVNLYETQDPALVGAIVAKFIEMRSRVPVPKVVLSVYSSKHRQPKEKFQEIMIR
jgi:hypothetical protein